MVVVLEPAKAKLIQTVALTDVGLWSGALDPAAKQLYVGTTDFSVHVHDLPGLQASKTGPLKGHGSYVTALIFLPASRALISGSFDKQLIWWKPTVSSRPVRQVDAGARVNGLAASRDGTLIAAAGSDLVGRLWDALTGKLLLRFEAGHPATTALGRHNTLYAVAFSPDGKQVATGDRAGTLCFWECASGKLQHKAAAPAFYSQAANQKTQASEYEWGGVRSLAYSPDGKTLVAGGMGPADQNSAGTDGAMRLEAFDVATGKSAAAFPIAGSKGMLMSMFFHPAGEWLVAAGGGGQNGIGFGGLCLWQYKLRDKANKPVPPLFHKSVCVLRDVVLGPDGSSVVAVGTLRDLTAGRIEVWDLSGKTAPSKPASPVKK
jgi:WD40 repeat protein